jgi:hypothetical protein
MVNWEGARESGSEFDSVDKHFLQTTNSCCATQSETIQQICKYSTMSYLSESYYICNARPRRMRHLFCIMQTFDSAILRSVSDMPYLGSVVRKRGSC